MKKPFKAPDETAVWKIRKSYSSNTVGARARSPDNYWIRIDVYFTLMGNEKADRLSDIVSVKYIEKANLYKYSEFLCLTPAVEGIIHELESLQHGLRFQNNSDEDTITRLIKSASLFWH